MNNQPMFDVEAGDSSYRMIPDDTPTADLVISYTHASTGFLIFLITH